MSLTVQTHLWISHNATSSFYSGRRTHPTDEALWVPQGAESRDVVLQYGLTAALTAGREQSEEALLTVLLAITVMEACTRDTLTC